MRGNPYDRLEQDAKRAQSHRSLQNHPYQV